MANVYDIFPSKYITAHDLNDKPHDLAIARVDVEKMRSYAGGEEEKKLVVYFDGAKKGLVLNKTNALAIAEICSTPESDAWTGTVVQLYSTQVNAFGSMVDAVRVRQVQAIQTQPAKTFDDPPQQDDFGPEGAWREGEDPKQVAA